MADSSQKNSGLPLMENFGPLAFLAGEWEGEKGHDLAPGADRGKAIVKFREIAKFEPMAPILNHEQTLFGLRYSMVAFPLGSADPFHEEHGYWLWDPSSQHVVKSFLIPRGLTVIAGGTATPDATEFEMKADVGSVTYGILSNPFLDKEFKTVHYRVKIIKLDDNTFSYEQDSQLQIKNQPSIFHHVDRNTLKRK